MLILLMEPLLVPDVWHTWFVWFSTHCLIIDFLWLSMYPYATWFVDPGREPAIKDLPGDIFGPSIHVSHCFTWFISRIKCRASATLDFERRGPSTHCSSVAWRFGLFWLLPVGRRSGEPFGEGMCEPTFLMPGTIFGELGRDIDVCTSIDALNWYVGIMLCAGTSPGTGLELATILRLRLSVRWVGTGLWAETFYLFFWLEKWKRIRMGGINYVSGFSLEEVYWVFRRQILLMPYSWSIDCHLNSSMGCIRVDVRRRWHHHTDPCRWRCRPRGRNLTDRGHQRNRIDYLIFKG